MPTGFVFVATQQIQGRGRGKNSWISPPGCLQFSIILRHPLNLSSASAVFIQYLLSLAVVEAVRAKKGYEVCIMIDKNSIWKMKINLKFYVCNQDIPLRLKWPNDIYVKFSSPSESPEIIKIGGVIVNSHFIQDEFLLIAGS